MIELTPRAREILAKAEAAARRFDPDARIRLIREGTGVSFAFAHDPADDDEVIDAGDVRLFVEAGLAGVVDVTEPHDQLVLRHNTGG